LTNVEFCYRRFGRKSYTKVYFNEFVANVLHDNIGIFIFVMEAVGGQKHPSEAKNGMKELIY
jgi:hypothetical protein